MGSLEDYINYKNDDKDKYGLSSIVRSYSVPINTQDIDFNTTENNWLKDLWGNPEKYNDEGKLIESATGLQSFDATKGWGGLGISLANLGMGHLNYRDKHAANKLNMELGRQQLKNNQNAQIARDNTLAVFNAHGNKPTKILGLKAYKTL
jgi:hypothetical protein